MSQTRFVFKDGEYCFWLIHFYTERSDLVIRTPEMQAPMVAFEKLKGERWKLYQDGKTRESLSIDLLEDPWEWCKPINYGSKEWPNVVRWVKACLKAGNQLGFECKIFANDEEIKWPELQLTIDGTFEIA